MSTPLMRVVRPLLLLATVLALIGCRSPLPQDASLPDDGIGTASVAIVVVADGVEGAPSRSRLRSLLEQSFADDQRIAPVPGAMVALVLGEARFEEIGDEVARYGVLSLDARRELLSIPIPVQRALVVRLERNDTEVLEPRREPMLGDDGQRLIDREAVVLSRRRHVRIAASLADLASGKLLWWRAWEAEPVAALRYVDYTGSSLAASVATTLTNTVVSGLQGPSAPPAVDMEQALVALFGTLVEEVSPR